MIVLALALYTLRLLGYSFIQLPFHALFFEVTNICLVQRLLTILKFLQVFKPFGNSLLIIAAMTYAKNNADITTMASLEVSNRKR